MTTEEEQLKRIQEGISAMRAALNEKDKNIKTLLETLEKRKRLAEQVTLVNDTLQLIATANDKASLEVLLYIQNIINQALKRMFVTGGYEISFRKSVTKGNNPMIHVELHERKANGEQIKLDFNLQTGDGVSQIVSFLFTLSLIEIRGLRPFIILDETLKGFHPAALPLVKNIISVFAKHGFQFVMVEYDLDLGKLYHVTQTKGVSTIEGTNATAEDIYTEDASNIGVKLGSDSDLEELEPSEQQVMGTNTRDHTGVVLDLTL